MRPCAMRMTHSPFSPASQYHRLSRSALSWGEALRIYFTILFGVGLLMVTYYYMAPIHHF